MIISMLRAISDSSIATTSTDPTSKPTLHSRFGISGLTLRCKEVERGRRANIQILNERKCPLLRVGQSFELEEIGAEYVMDIEFPSFLPTMGQEEMRTEFPSTAIQVEMEILSKHITPFPFFFG